MIDHTGIVVTDVHKSKAFYVKALAPLGYQLLMEFPDAAGFGEPPKMDFWIGKQATPYPPLHIAFSARSRNIVDEFYKAALAAGAKDNGAPGLRPHYHPNYYAAFVRDPDGHNIEAVCHSAQ